MNTTTKGLLSVLLGSAALVSSPPSVRAQPWEGSDHHGTIVVTRKAVREIAGGPALLHLYSFTAGGTIFVAPLAQGGDPDCSGPALDALPYAVPLAADQVLVLRVGPLEVACLATTADRSFELLWHAFEDH